MPWRLAQLEPEYWSVTVQQVVKRALKPGLIDCRRLPDIAWRGLPSGVAPTRPPAGRRRSPGAACPRLQAEPRVGRPPGAPSTSSRSTTACDWTA